MAEHVWHPRWGPEQKKDIKLKLREHELNVDFT